MRTLRLDKTTWDWEMDPSNGLLPVIDSATLDNQGRPIGEGEYCAQGVAQAVRTWRNDAYFHKDENVRYLEDILGFSPPDSYLEEELRTQGLRVPLVNSIQVLRLDRTGGALTGDLRVYTENGSVYDVDIS